MRPSQSTPPRAPVADDRVEQIERWFVRQGIPHFIADYSATRDIFTRAAPALTAVFLVEMLGAVNLDWPAWANAVALLGGLLILVAVWATANRARGLPALRRPERVDAPELAVFVLAPALLPLVFGGQLLAAGVTVAVNLGLLGALYLATSYGVVPMSRWAAVHLVEQLATLTGLLVRALPLLLLFVTFLFINAEVWEVADGLTPGLLAVVAGLFALVGTVFILFRLPRELERLGAFADGDELRRCAEGTPAHGLPPPAAPAPPLSRRQWGNVVLVLLFTQGLQILLVSVTIATFFVVFGLLTVSPATIEAWTGEALAGVGTFELLGRETAFTSELLHVSALLGAFSGLYFAVYLVTDATYREEFFDEVLSDVRRALAVRSLYLGAVAGEPQRSKA